MLTDRATAVAHTPVVHDAHHHCLLVPGHTLEQGMLQAQTQGPKSVLARLQFFLLAIPGYM